MVAKASQRRGFARLSGGRDTGAVYASRPSRLISTRAGGRHGPRRESGDARGAAPSRSVQDASKTLDEIMAHLKNTGFYRDFPPDGAGLVSWVVAMSYGFLITLKVEADKVRSVNRYMEQKAWGAFRYEVFPAYDFAPIAADLKKQHA